MQTVALGVYLTETTHDALWLGLLTVCAWTPALDRRATRRRHRRPRRSTALDPGEQSRHGPHRERARDGRIDPSPHAASWRATSPIAEGLCGSASWAAWQSLLPDLVDRDEVFAAVSLSSAQFNLGRIIGPLLAGVTLAFASPGCLFRDQRRVLRLRRHHVLLRALARLGPSRRRRFDLWFETKHGAQARVVGQGLSLPDHRHRHRRADRESLHRVGARDGHPDAALGSRRRRVAGRGPGRRRGDRRGHAAGDRPTYVAHRGAARFARDRRALPRALRPRARPGVRGRGAGACSGARTSAR